MPTFIKVQQFLNASSAEKIKATNELIFSESKTDEEKAALAAWANPLLEKAIGELTTDELFALSICLYMGDGIPRQLDKSQKYKEASERLKQSVHPSTHADQAASSNAKPVLTRLEIVGQLGASIAKQDLKAVIENLYLALEIRNFNLVCWALSYLNTKHLELSENEKIGKTGSDLAMINQTFKEMLPKFTPWLNPHFELDDDLLLGHYRDIKKLCGNKSFSGIYAFLTFRSYVAKLEKYKIEKDIFLVAYNLGDLEDTLSERFTITNGGDALYKYLEKTGDEFSPHFDENHRFYALLISFRASRFWALKYEFQNKKDDVDIQLYIACKMALHPACPNDLRTQAEKFIIETARKEVPTLFYTPSTSRINLCKFFTALIVNREAITEIDESRGNGKYEVDLDKVMLRESLQQKLNEDSQALLIKSMTAYDIEYKYKIRAIEKKGLAKASSSSYPAVSDSYARAAAKQATFRYASASASAASANKSEKQDSEAAKESLDKALGHLRFH